MAEVATRSKLEDEELMDEDIYSRLSFRNYDPLDEKLRKFKKSRVEVPPIAKEITDKLEKLAKEPPNLDTLSVAPKKITWDLERDIEKKLEKLEARTQRAIVEMMREKLQKGSSGDSMSEKISLQSAKDIAEGTMEED